MFDGLSGHNMSRIYFSLDTGLFDQIFQVEIWKSGNPSYKLFPILIYFAERNSID